MKKLDVNNAIDMVNKAVKENLVWILFSISLRIFFDLLVLNTDDLIFTCVDIPIVTELLFHDFTYSCLIEFSQELISDHHDSTQTK